MKLYLIYIFDFIIIMIILCSAVSFDIKFRLIPNRIIKIYVIFSILFNFLESFYYIDFFLGYILLKFALIISISLICILLFSIHIIGGGDGKLAIISFSLIPFEFLSSFFQFFLFFFTIFLILAVSIFDIWKKDTDLFYFKGWIKYRISFTLPRNKQKKQEKNTFPLTVPYTISFFISFLILIGI
jgi:Flp pilus assembly protein protease CpaA